MFSELLLYFVRFFPASRENFSLVCSMDPHQMNGWLHRPEGGCPVLASFPQAPRSVCFLCLYCFVCVCVFGILRNLCICSAERTRVVYRRRLMEFSEYALVSSATSHPLFLILSALRVLRIRTSAVRELPAVL